jgi:hypothetical protein
MIAECLKDGLWLGINPIEEAILSGAVYRIQR